MTLLIYYLKDGGGYILSTDLVREMVDKLPACRYNPNEDVFVGALVSLCNGYATSIPYITGFSNGQNILGHRIFIGKNIAYEDMEGLMKTQEGV